MSTLGLGFLASEAVLTPLMAILLGAAVLTLGYTARRRRKYGPLLVGTLGAAILAASKFAPEQPWLGYAGLVPLLGASVWNVRLGASQDACPPTGSDINA
jgi:peptidoglycan/LPS O-acetylase OafA/YrhL